MVWPALGSRTAKEQNSEKLLLEIYIFVYLGPLVQRPPIAYMSV